jgi:hypothetical membrane protein
MRRFAGLCGVLAFVTFNAGWIVGDLVQRPAFSPADDDISYLGALTAKSPWLYNQIAANLSGALIVLLAIGLWCELRTSWLGRAGAVLLAGVGVGAFLDGLFHLDCQSIDTGCTNTSWHAHAHKIESGATLGLTFAAIVILAAGFRRVSRWRNWSLPVLGVLPGVIAANVAFSAIGVGAAVRAGTVVLFLGFAALGLRLVVAHGRDSIPSRSTSGGYTTQQAAAEDRTRPVPRTLRTETRDRQ